MSAQLTSSPRTNGPVRYVSRMSSCRASSLMFCARTSGSICLYVAACAPQMQAQQLLPAGGLSTASLHEAVGNHVALVEHNKLVWQQPSTH